jgi:hypothetical protein
MNLLGGEGKGLQGSVSRRSRRERKDHGEDDNKGDGAEK